MSADDEYVAYVGTRWADLVRAAVLLGCARDEAEPLVRSVLLRAYRGWEEAWRDDLSEIHVGGLLLAAVRRRPAEARQDDGPHADVRTDLVRTLDQTTSNAREPLVLHYVAGLTLDQTARVLGDPPAEVERRVRDALAALPELVDEPDDLRYAPGGGDPT